MTGTAADLPLPVRDYSKLAPGPSSNTVTVISTLPVSQIGRKSTASARCTPPLNWSVRLKYKWNDSMKWSTDEISYIMSLGEKLFLFFAIINLAVCVLAPLFGGAFIFNGVLVYGSWVGFALCVLFEARRIKEKQIDDRRFLLLNVFEFLCWIFWCVLIFPFPYNLIGGALGGALFLFLKLSWYKRFKEQIAAQEIK